MFSNQLVILSLLLVGLSLSGLSKLSEAYNRRKMLDRLLEATDYNEIHTIFLGLGGPFQEYVDLCNVREENCTPERILFENKQADLLGQGAKDYVNTFVVQQQELCEETFVKRLSFQYENYLKDWQGKEYFEQYINFVLPWPTIAMEWDEMTENIRKNIQEYLNWRMVQSPRPRNIHHLRASLLESSKMVYDWLGNFYTSFKTGRIFLPALTYEQQHAIVLGKIAALTRHQAHIHRFTI